MGGIHLKVSGYLEEKKGSETDGIIHHQHCYDMLTHKVVAGANTPRRLMEAGNTGESATVTVARWS